MASPLELLLEHWLHQPDTLSPDESVKLVRLTQLTFSYWAMHKSTLECEDDPEGAPLIAYALEEHVFNQITEVFEELMQIAQGVR